MRTLGHCSGKIVTAFIMERQNEMNERIEEMRLCDQKLTALQQIKETCKNGPYVSQVGYSNYNIIWGQQATAAEHGECHKDIYISKHGRFHDGTHSLCRHKRLILRYWNARFLISRQLCINNNIPVNIIFLPYSINHEINHTHCSYD